MKGSNLWERGFQDAALREFDDLRKLREAMDWEACRPLIERRLPFQWLDHRSFKRFVGLLNDCGDVPDQQTIWKYRRQLAESGCTKELFEACHNAFPRGDTA